MLYITMKNIHIHVYTCTCTCTCTMKTYCTYGVGTPCAPLRCRYCRGCRCIAEDAGIPGSMLCVLATGSDLLNSTISLTVARSRSSSSASFFDFLSLIALAACYKAAQCICLQSSMNHYRRTLEFLPAWATQLRTSLA